MEYVSDTPSLRELNAGRLNKNAAEVARQKWDIILRDIKFLEETSEIALNFILNEMEEFLQYVNANKKDTSLEFLNVLSEAYVYLYDMPKDTREEHLKKYDNVMKKAMELSDYLQELLAKAPKFAPPQLPWRR